MTEERAKQVRQRVRQLRGFYVHFAIYTVVIAGIALINWITSPSFWLVVWPMVGWGIGLAARRIGHVRGLAVRSGVGGAQDPRAC